jgi:hypothetical protein
MPEKTMKDNRGNAVPVRYVSKADKERDKLVKKLFAKAEKLNKTLADFRVECMAGIESYVAWAAKESDVKIGGVRGNVTLTSFDGALKVTRMRQDSIEFDERLQVAQELIREYIAEKAAGLDADLHALIDDAFDGANGRLNAARVLGLLKIQIKAAKWQKAMDLIRESIRVASTREYARFYRRPGGPESEYKLLPLDIAAV